MKCPPHRSGGFSITELMVALALGLLVVGAVFVSYSATIMGSRQQRAQSEMREGAQLALSLLRRDLMLAGYIHPVALTGTRFEALDPLISQRPVFGCATTFVAASAPVGQGTCDAKGPGGDAIEINFEATRETALLSAAGLLADCVGRSLDEPGGQPQQTPATALTRIPATHRYFVVPAVANGPPMALACASAGETTQRVVPHIEEMHLTYGISSGWQAEDPATRRPVRYVAAADVAAVEWASVVAVRVCVLMRSATPVLAGDEAATDAYRGCDGLQQASTDGFLRRAFLTTVGLRSREPQQ